MIINEVRDWNPQIFDVIVEDESTTIVLHFHKDDADYEYRIGNDADISKALREIKGRLNANLDRLPSEYDVDAFVSSVRAQMTALVHFKDESWKGIVMGALDEKIVGEELLKKLLVFSGLSASLKKKVHVLLMGDSQMGKSFIMKIVGSTVFKERFILASTMSSKSPYAMAAEDPTVFKGKILMIDELKDLSEEARATIKAMASNETDELVQFTLDEKRKLHHVKIIGMPVIWTCSMESFGDAGNQLSNRFLKVSIDETIAQSSRVAIFQRAESKFGLPGESTSKAESASLLIAEIIREHDFLILNPFDEFLEMDINGPRNRFPMFNALLNAITYANRHKRPVIVKDNRDCLMASKRDNLEAIELYSHYAGTQAIALAPRYIEVLEAMSDTTAKHPEDIALAINEKRLKSRKKPISSTTCYNYLRELTEKDLATSEREIENYGDMERKGKAYLYKRIVDMSSIICSQIRFVEHSGDERKMLARYFDELETQCPQLYDEHDRDQLIDSLVDG